MRKSSASKVSRKALSVLMSVVLAVGLMPLPAYAELAPGSVDLGAGGVAEGSYSSVVGAVADAAGQMIAQGYPISGSDHIWLAEADDDANARVSLLHTSHRYNIVSDNGYVNASQEIGLESLTESDPRTYVVELDDDYSADSHMVFNGLYYSTYYESSDEIGYPSYAGGPFPLPSGLYKVHFKNNAGAIIGQEQVFRVVNDGAFISDYFLNSDSSYDGMVIRTHGTQTVLSSPVAQTAKLDVQATIDGHDYDVDESSALKLEGVALYKSGKTWAEIESDTNKAENVSDGYLYDDWASRATFTDGSKRVQVWSSATDEPLAGARIEAGRYNYDDIYVNLDDFSFSGVQLETGVYFPFLEVSIDGKAVTAAFRPIEITADGEIAPASPQITTASVPDATANLPYSCTLEGRSGAAAGGTFSWAVMAGSLPAGLTLNAATGELNGTPTATGAFTFTATLTETVGADSRTATREYAMTVHDTITLGEVTYPHGPMWLTEKTDFPVSVGISADLTEAGYSQSKATVSVYPANSDDSLSIGKQADMAIDGQTLVGQPSVLDYSKANSAATTYPVGIERIEVVVELYDDAGKQVTEKVQVDYPDGPQLVDKPVVLRAEVENPDVSFGGWLDFPAIEGIPVDEGIVSVRPLDTTGGQTGSEKWAIREISSGGYGDARFALAPGDYVFTVEGLVGNYSDPDNPFRVDIMGGSDNASRVSGTHPAQYLVSVSPNEATAVDVRFSDKNLECHTAEVVFETADGGYEDNTCYYSTEWYRKSGDEYKLVGSGSSVVLADGDKDNLYVKVTPYGSDSVAFADPGYVAVPNGQNVVRVVVPRKTHVNANVTLSFVSDWVPQGSWGVVQVQRPLPDGSSTVSKNSWITSATQLIEDVTPGTIITFSPNVASGCGPKSYTVPDNIEAGTTIDVPLQAPLAKGVVTFNKLQLVTNDDTRTRDDDAQAKRTLNMTLLDNDVKIQVRKHGSAETVPFGIIDGKRLVIQDEQANIVTGAQYDIELKLFEPYGQYTTYGALVGKQAVTHTFTATLGADANCTADVTALADGNALVVYSNRNRQSCKLLLYNAAGNLVEDSSVWSDYSSGTVQMPHLPAGNYTLYAVTWDALMAEQGKASTNQFREKYDTKDELEAMIAANGWASASGAVFEQATSTTFAIVQNKMIVVPEQVTGNEAFALPRGDMNSIVDRENSSVTAQASYSDNVTISVYAQLSEGVALDLLDASKARSDHAEQAKDTAYIELYTNQKSASGEAAEGIVNVRALTINGRGMDLTRWNSAGDFKGSLLKRDWYAANNSGATAHMADGCLAVNLNVAKGINEGCAQFPLRMSVTVPRTNAEETEVWAWLVVDGKRSLIGTFNQQYQDVSLTVPKVAAQEWGEFWVHGETGSGADVSIYLDGMRVSTTRADDYGYYSTPVSLPAYVDEGETHQVTASAKWATKDGAKVSATSQAQEVVYTKDKRAAVNTITMFYQERPGGAYNVMTVYDRGRLTAKYLSYYRSENENGTDADADHAKYYWMTTITNPDRCKNVQVGVSRSGEDLVLDTEATIEKVSRWIPDVRKDVHKLHAQAEEPMGNLIIGGGAIITRDALSKGGAFVTEPIYLAYAPSDVYVLFDDVVDKPATAVAASKRCLGFRAEGITNTSMADYLTAMATAPNKYVQVVTNSNIDNERKVEVLDQSSTDYANHYTTKDPGCVSEWLALSSGDERCPGVLLLKHEVTTTQSVNASAAKSVVNTVNGLYASAKGLPFNGAYENKTLHYDGLTVVAVSTAADYGRDDWLYYIQTVDAEDNMRMEMMYRDDTSVSGKYRYTQVRVDKQTLTITEWDESISQRKVITYQIDASMLDSDAVYSGQLAYQWNAILSVLQLGYEETVVKMGLHFDDNGRLATSGLGGASVDMAAASAGETADSAASTAQGGDLSAQDYTYTVSKRLCLVAHVTEGEPNPDAQDVKDWAEYAPKYNSDEHMSSAEARNLQNYIDDNRMKALDVDSMFNAEHLGGGYLNNYTWANGGVWVGDLGSRVQDITGAAVDGPAAVAEAGGETLFSDVFGNGQGTMSQEYVDKAQELYQKARMVERKGGKVDWDRFPSRLDNWFRYLDSRRAQAYGHCGNGKLDPSGIVYEGMLSNPVEGATVTLYTYNANGGNAIMLDSEMFGVEPNPQTTGDDGRYQWFVPEGYWQVRVSKAGYEPASTGDHPELGIGATNVLTVEGTQVDSPDGKYWMPVLPEQVDVNIPLISTVAPKVESVTADENGVTVVFDKPLKVATVKASMFSIAAGSGAAAAPARVEAVDADEAADGSGTMLARAFFLAYGSSLQFDSGVNTVTTKLTTSATGAQSYAGTAIEASSCNVAHESEVDMGNAPDPQPQPQPGPDPEPQPQPGPEPQPQPQPGPDPQPQPQPDNPDEPDPQPQPQPTVKTSIVGATIAPISEQVYTSYPIEPALTVTLGGKKLAAGTDFTVTYAGNVEVGTATATITGAGLYEGQAKATFKIAHKPPTTVFSDLDANGWYLQPKPGSGSFAGAVNTLYLDYILARGIMSGYAGTTKFGPDDPVSRAQVAVILYRADTGETAATTNNAVKPAFSDCPQGEYYSAAVKWANEKGIVTGYAGTGRFGPNDPVTREQLATMIHRFAVKYRGTPDKSTSLGAYVDAGSVSGFAVEAMRYNVAIGAMGAGGNRLNPQDGASRVQTAKIVAVVLHDVLAV